MRLRSIVKILEYSDMPEYSFFDGKENNGMKAYDLWKKDSFDYPEEMQKILGYLKAHGDLRVSADTVERLYREFSGIYSAGWLIVSAEYLAGFAEWLDEYDL